MSEILVNVLEKTVERGSLQFQRIDRTGMWAGSCISYSEQSQLENHYADITCKVTEFLHIKGYYGLLM